MARAAGRQPASERRWRKYVVTEHEVVLHEEEVVTEKRTDPRERIRMTKDTVTGEQQVSEEVRKEQIEAEGESPRDAA